MERLGTLQLHPVYPGLQGNVKDRRSRPPELVGGLIGSRWPAQMVDPRQRAFLDAVTGEAVTEVMGSEP